MVRRSAGLSLSLHYEALPSKLVRTSPFWTVSKCSFSRLKADHRFLAGKSRVGTLNEGTSHETDPQRRIELQRGGVGNQPLCECWSIHRHADESVRDRRRQLNQFHNRICPSAGHPFRNRGAHRRGSCSGQLDRSPSEWSCRIHEQQFGLDQSGWRIFSVQLPRQQHQMLGSKRRIERRSGPYLRHYALRLRNQRQSFKRNFILNSNIFGLAAILDTTQTGNYGAAFIAQTQRDWITVEPRFRY